MKLFRNVTCLMLVVAVANGAIADEKQKKGKRNRRQPSVTQRFVAKMELTGEQKEKVAAIDKKFAAQAKELAEKRQAILTPEQRKAQQEAMQAVRAARKEGKDAKDIRKQIADAVQLTEAQQKQQKELQAAQRKLSMQVLAELKPILTAEQQEKLPKFRSGKRKSDKSNKPGDEPRKRKTKRDAA